jgi:hypothetical protein
MKEFKIAYYGSDKEIIPVLEKEINNFLVPTNKIYFIQSLPDGTHKNLCEIISSTGINILLIDLSNNPHIQDALRILYYEIHVNKLQIIGLWNLVQDQNLLKWRFELGINTHFCYQIRDPGSIESLILSLARLLNIEKDGFSFYQKEINKPIEINCPIRINFFDVKSTQIESDIPFKTGEIISCNFPALPDFPFNEFEIESISKLDLNYPQENQATLNYIFHDEFGQIYKEHWDELDDIKYLELMEINPQIFQNLDEIQVKSILDQFSNNKSISHAKKVAIKRLIDRIGKLPNYDILKNIIVDINFSPFNFSEDALWNHPYTFLIVKTIEDNLNVLNTCAAHILTYVSEQKLNEENFEESIEFIQLKTICSRLNNLKKKFDKDLPLVLIYNLEMKEEKLSELLNYKKITVKNFEYDFKDNLAFLKQYSSSPNFLQGLSFYKKKGFKVYPNSLSELSRGFLKKEVKLISISENEIIFKSNLPLKKDFSFMFKIEENLRYFATIYKIKHDNDTSIFYGILNSLNEEEKKELRKIIIKG